MLRLDEFESVFLSASKQRYEHASVQIRRAIVFSDLEGEVARVFTRDVSQFMRVLGPDLEWISADGGRYEDVGQLLELVEQHQPDLICAYRNLKGRAADYPFSLGAHADVLTQATSTPVLLLPRPDAEGRLPSRCENTDRVMVLTDHLTGSDRLVHFGVHFVELGGRLQLVHLEDDATFERYMAVIAKIPTIDTDEARATISRQLLKEPHDYIRSCAEELARHRPQLGVEELVLMGHRVADAQRLITEHESDLLVMNTKDEDQLAIHGLAYPLAIELRDLPLLLL